MKIRIAMVLATLVAAAGGAHAQFQKPEDAVKYRQSALTVMANHFGRLGAMANGRIPFDAKVAQENADVVLTVAKLPWAGFTPDTKDLKTRVKPVAWTEMDKVKAGADKLVAAATQLDAAAKTGNLDAIKKAVGETAATCKACHDAYRE